MAVRLPIVLGANAERQQLQSADTLYAPNFQSDVAAMGSITATGTIYASDDIGAPVGKEFQWNLVGGSSRLYMANGYAGTVFLSAINGRIAYLMAASGIAGAAATMIENMSISQAGDLTLPNGVIKIGTLQVVGNRRTGWTAATGTATRSSFATASVTLAALAQAVKALIDDLIAHGLIGT